MSNFTKSKQKSFLSVLSCKVQSNANDSNIEESFLSQVSVTDLS